MGHRSRDRRKFLPKQIRIPSAFTFALLLMTLVWPAGHAEGPLWSEGGLKPGGKAREVNASGGFLYISDTWANEIWRVDPATGSYVVYAGLTGVIDARPDAAGNIWAADWSAKSLVRIDAAGTATSWPVNALVLWGLAFDGEGRVWAADSAGVNGRLLRFDPSTRELCSFFLPAGGAAEYPVYRDGAVWVGDYANGRILRLDVGTHEATWWEVGASAFPEGLAFDANSVWFADHGQALLGRLDWDRGELTRYVLPAGSKPAMLAVVDGRIWYTEERLGTVGVLDPAQAVGQPAVATATASTLTPFCSTLPAGSVRSLATRTGTLTFLNLTPNLFVDAGGWRIYRLPAGSKPWGIASASGDLWIADGGRQALIRALFEAGSPTPTPSSTSTETPTPTSTPTVTFAPTGTQTPASTGAATKTAYLPLVMR